MTKLALFLVGFCFLGFANTQILNDLKGKFKQAATNNASDFNTSRSNKEKNQKLTEQGGGSFDEDFDEDIIENETDSSSQIPSISDEYLFQMKSAYSIRNAGTESPELLEFYLGENAFYILSEGSLLINDLIRQQLIFADSASNTAYVQNNPLVELPMGMSSLLQKTGNSKQVMGMKAYEFHFITPQTKLWITESSVLLEAERKTFRQLEQTMLGFNYSELSGMDGILVEFQTIDEQNRMITEFILSELVKKPNKISLKGYQVVAN